MRTGKTNPSRAEVEAIPLLSDASSPPALGATLRWRRSTVKVSAAGRWPLEGLKTLSWGYTSPSRFGMCENLFYSKLSLERGRTFEKEITLYSGSLGSGVDEERS